MGDVGHLAEISDDPDDEHSDYGRGWQDGYRAGRQSIAADLRRDIKHQSGWLWFTYGESMLLAVAKWIEGEAATPDGPRRWALPDDRETAKAAIHRPLHDLNVRIVGLAVGDCHCNLIAEVVLDALTDATPAADGQDGRDG